MGSADAEPFAYHRARRSGRRTAAPEEPPLSRMKQLAPLFLAGAALAAVTACSHKASAPGTSSSSASAGTAGAGGVAGAGGAASSAGGAAGKGGTAGAAGTSSAGGAAAGGAAGNGGSATAASTGNTASTGTGCHLCSPGGIACPVDPCACQDGTMTQTGACMAHCCATCDQACAGHGGAENCLVTGQFCGAGASEPCCSKDCDMNTMLCD
jgi:hypothetical protein